MIFEDVRSRLTHYSHCSSHPIVFLCMRQFRSAIPPLSRPDPVQLVKASDHCLWVTWKRYSSVRIC